MLKRNNAPLVACCLGLLFLFSILPSDLLHGHGHGNAIHQDGMAEHPEFQEDCSLCDMQLPLDVLLEDHSDGLLLGISQGGPIWHSIHLPANSGLQHADRGPPDSNTRSAPG